MSELHESFHGTPDGHMWRDQVIPMFPVEQAGFRHFLPTPPGFFQWPKRLRPGIIGIVNSVQRLIVLCFLSLPLVTATAQAKPSATRTVSPSVFVLVGGTATRVGGNAHSDFPGGKNATFSAGLDVGFHSFGHYMLAAEARGSYPVQSGTIVAERSIAGGARLSYESDANHAFRPYVDALFGRGQMDYQRGGYISGNLLYTRTASNLYGGGAGAELDITDHFSLKLDGQLQHWNTPVVTGGSVWSTQVGVGVVYRIGAGRFPLP